MKLKLRGILIAIALLSIGGVMAAGFVTLRNEYRAAYQRAEIRTMDWARMLEEYAKRTFITGDLILGEIADFVRQAGDPEALRNSPAAYDFLNELSRVTGGDYLMIVDARGVPVSVAVAFPAPAVDLSDRPWFRAHAMDGQHRVVGEAIHSRITNEVSFTYSRRLEDANGRFIGAAQQSMRPTIFDQGDIASALGQGATLSMWTPDGVLVARTGLKPEHLTETIRSRTLPGELAKAPAGSYETVSAVDGMRRIVSYRSVPGWPAIVAASVPIDTILAPWRRALWSSVLLLGAVGLAAAGLAAWGVKVSVTEDRLMGRLRDLNAELQAALAEQQTLLSEIHHRVKNSLQVAASLLRLQGHQFKDERVRAAFEETNERLRSVALVHETLYRLRGSGALDLKAYLHSLARELSHVHGTERRGITVLVEGDDVFLDIDRSLPVALLVTEVLSNALTHAFPDGRAGTVTIRLQYDPNTQGVAIFVQDDGVGMSPDTWPKRLGMKLIEAFARQLDAEISWRDDKGTRFEVRFSLGPARPVAG